MKNLVVGLLVAISFVGMVVGILIWGSDRVCQKGFSADFKQTAQYKAMQCP